LWTPNSVLNAEGCRIKAIYLNRLLLQLLILYAYAHKNSRSRRRLYLLPLLMALVVPPSGHVPLIEKPLPLVLRIRVDGCPS